MQPTGSEDVVPFATKSDLAYTRVRALILTGRAGARRRPAAGHAGPDDRHEHHSPARGAPPPQAGGAGHPRRAPGRPGRARWMRPRPATCVELRQSLDPLAASLAASRRTEEELAEIALGARPVSSRCPATPRSSSWSTTGDSMPRSTGPPTTGCSPRPSTGSGTRATATACTPSRTSGTSGIAPAPPTSTACCSRPSGTATATAAAELMRAARGGQPRGARSGTAHRRR